MLWRRFQQVKMISCILRYLVILYTRTCACYSHRGLDVSLRKGNGSCVFAKPVLPWTYSLSPSLRGGFRWVKIRNKVARGGRWEEEKAGTSLPLFPLPFVPCALSFSFFPASLLHKEPSSEERDIRAFDTRKNKTRPK